MKRQQLLFMLIIFICGSSAAYEYRVPVNINPLVNPEVLMPGDEAIVSIELQNGASSYGVGRDAGAGSSAQSTVLSTPINRTTLKGSDEIQVISKDHEDLGMIGPNDKVVVYYALKKACAGYPDLLRDLFKYLSNLEDRGARPNREAQLIGRFSKTHAAAQARLKKSGVPVKEGRISCAFPPEGIQDNTIRIAGLKLLLIAAKLAFHNNRDQVKFSLYDSRTHSMQRFMRFLDNARAKARPWIHNALWPCRFLVNLS